jgi:hypothetical protein
MVSCVRGIKEIRRSGDSKYSEKLAVGKEKPTGST